MPAFKVYAASKHGNIFSSKHATWNFKAVPWTIGQDFAAPTCATCHVSLLINTDEEVVVERTHQMNNRLPWRILGLIYAHPHPANPDTSIIRNKDGLPLPTDFSGGFAANYLIDESEMGTRRQAMQAAWQAGDLEELMTAARWLKGSAGTLGFDLFTEPAEQLETAAGAEDRNVVADALQTIHTLTVRVQKSAGPAVKETDNPAIGANAG